MNLKLCVKNDEQLWIELNREFMNYEIQDSCLWNNTHKNSDDVFKKTFDEALANPNLIRLLLIEHENEMIGFANLMVIFSVWAQGRALILDDLYIRETHRGKGIGKEVMKSIEQFAEDNKFKRLQFQSEVSNNGAYSFYTGIGYKPTTMNFYIKHFNSI